MKSEPITTTHEKWVVWYFSKTRSEWLIDDVFYTLQAARQCIQNQPPHRPPVDAWRIVHEVEVTTVTKTVIE
jgi:hypothetical protein